MASLMQTLREERAWEAEFEDGTSCQDCEWCEVTKDPYSTGDSPSIRECTAPSAKDCFEWSLED